MSNTKDKDPDLKDPKEMRYGNALGDHQFRDSTRIVQEAKEYFTSHGIEPMYEPLVPLNKPPGTVAEETIAVKTNLLGVDTPRTVTIYKYHVEIKILNDLKGRNMAVDKGPGGNGSEHHSGDEGSNGNGKASPDGEKTSSSDGNGNSTSSDDGSNGNGNGSNGDGSNGDGSNGGSNGNGGSHGSSMSDEEQDIDTKMMKTLYDLKTARAKGDPNMLHRRNSHRKIWQEMFVQKASELPGDLHSFYYDLESLAYSIRPVKFDKLGTKELRLRTGEHFFSESILVVVQLKKAGEIDIGYEAFPFGNVLDGVKTDLSKINYDVLQFLEIATSQAVLFNPDEFVCFPGGKTYLQYPGHFTFSQQDLVELPNHNVLGIGSQKSVRYVEGPRGRRFQNVAVVVENKKTPFHKIGTLADIAYQLGVVDGNCRPRNNDVQVLVAPFVGLYVENALARARDLAMEDKVPFYRVMSFTSEARASNFKCVTDNVDEEAMTIQQYYLVKKNIHLQYPECPVVTVKRGVGKYAITLNFPMEMLQLAENQRVSTTRQTAEMISKLIRAAAIPPHKSDEQIAKHVKALELNKGNGNLHLQNAGLVLYDPFVVKARRLIHPTIVYDRNELARVDSLGKWNAHMSMRFLIPGKCKIWAMTYIMDYRHGERTDRIQPMMQELSNQMVQLGNTRGMAIPHPANIGVIRDNYDEMRKRFEQMVENKVEFAFFVTSNNVKGMHDIMKWLERQYELCTQDLKLSTMENIVNKRQRLTLENVLMKTNVKLGGLNNSIQIDNAEFNKMLDKMTLYIGFGMNNAPGTPIEDFERVIKFDKHGKKIDQGPPPPPAVLGFAANDGVHPFEFTGDYVFQPGRRDEKIMLNGRSLEDLRPVLQEIFETVIERFKKHRGGLPNRIVVFRNGCSEGQFVNIISYEIPVINLALKNMGCENVPLTFMVPNKLHNVRAYPLNSDPQARPPEQNIKPGFVIDTGIVSPGMQEFYLCSHTTLQGTAKIPRYTVLHTTDEEMTADMLHQAVYALSYGHQIVRSPTSLPSPAFIAMRYAERGRKVLNAYTNNSPNYKYLHAHYRGGPPFPGIERYAAKMDVFDSEEQKAKVNLYNEELTLFNSETLRNRRINA